MIVALLLAHEAVEELEQVRGFVRYSTKVPASVVASIFGTKSWATSSGVAARHAEGELPQFRCAIFQQ